MKFSHALPALAALLSFQTGCLNLITDAIEKDKKEKQALEADQKIETAYKEKDQAALKEVLKTAPKDQRKKAIGYFVELQVDDLKTMPCEDFAAAFEPVKVSETRTTKSDKTEFSRHLDSVTPEERKRIGVLLTKRAVECKVAKVLFETNQRIGMQQKDRPKLLAELEADGEPVFDVFLAMLEDSSQKKPWIDGYVVGNWLADSHEAKDCAPLFAKSKDGDINARAELLFFYSKKSCKKEAVEVAKELLTSKSAGYRARACRSMSDIGDKSLLPKMKILAKDDPARQLEDSDRGIWVYRYVTYPVRETCQQAVNELEIRD